MIETHELTKMYGELYALNRLNLTLQQGDVYGFIGPNGAGKTTTMRILATLLNPSWGEATVCGYSIYTGSKEIRRVIGYMPDFFGVYDDMKVIEYLEFFAAAYRIKGAERRKKCEQVLELVDLGYKRDALVTSLSRGMTQRLGLARVLLHEPQVLLLDEPASGLDPRARIEMRGLIKELRNMGKTIMLSSHSWLGGSTTSVSWSGTFTPRFAQISGPCTSPPVLNPNSCARLCNSGSLSEMSCSLSFRIACAMGCPPTRA